MEIYKPKKINKMTTETKQYKPVKNLLSKGSTNSKTAKNDSETYILYLAPYNQNSKKINICPKASKGCAAACLNTAGLAGVYKSIQLSRQNKTEYFLHDKKTFINQLAKELIKINLKAAKNTNQTLIRLNGTSDLDFIYLLKKYAAFDIANYQNLHFYDYTKILGKVKKYSNDKNYTLTFSRAEDNEKQIFEAVKYGANVSAVFSGDLPKTYKGVPVVDGDKTDNEMLKFKSVILGLKAKGKAKRDESGFVINNN